MEKDIKIFLTGDREKDTRRVTYFIFITLVSVLSLVVAILYYVIYDVEVSQVLFVLDTVYAIIFLIDFILRYRVVEDKRHYMLTWGWLDLITSIPGIPGLRIIRSILTIRDSRQIFSVTPDEIAEQARESVAESVLYIIVLIGLVVISIGSIFIVWVEADAPGAEITSGYDAVWWTLVTVSTVGYGDEFPVTVAGRIIGAFMIVVGVALFTTITSFLASTFTDRGAKKQREEQLELVRKNAQHVEEFLERIIALEEMIAERTGIAESEIKDVEESAGDEEED